MKHYTIKETAVNEGILSLKLIPNSYKDKLDYQAGQYIALSYKTSSGRKSLVRCFSVASAPNDNAELEFAIRVGGDFTKTLSKLQKNADIYIEGPFGNFVYDRDQDKKLVLIAGGIGITPIISIVRELSMNHSHIPITVMYSYRNGHSIPYSDELRDLQADNPKLRVAIFVTNSATKPNLPRMFSGRMNEQHIKQVVDGEYTGSSYFVCGPEGFLESTLSMLAKHGINEDKIIIESFVQSKKVLTNNGHSIQRLTYTFTGIALLIGFLGVSYLDLSRYVPAATSSSRVETNVVNAQTNHTSATNSPTSSSSLSTTDSGSTKESTTIQNTTSSNTSKSSTSTQNTNSSNQNYQQPTTSVS